MSRLKSAGFTGPAVTTAVLCLAALATAPAAAATAPAAPGCSAGYVCVYNASGSSRAFWNSDPNFAGDLYADGSVVDNNVVSVANSSSSEAHFYLNAGYNTFLFCVNPGSEFHGFSATGASSLLLRTGTPISCY